MMRSNNKIKPYSHSELNITVCFRKMILSRSLKDLRVSACSACFVFLKYKFLCTCKEFVWILPHYCWHNHWVSKRKSIIIIHHSTFAAVGNNVGQENHPLSLLMCICALLHCKILEFHFEIKLFSINHIIKPLVFTVWPLQFCHFTKKKKNPIATVYTASLTVLILWASIEKNVLVASWPNDWSRCDCAHLWYLSCSHTTLIVNMSQRKIGTDWT